MTGGSINFLTGRNEHLTWEMPAAMKLEQGVFSQLTLPVVAPAFFIVTNYILDVDFGIAFTCSNSEVQ